MPEAWSPKRERQYEHIKESYEEQGKSEDKAEELAARTVNKTRSEKGETKELQRRRASRKR
jgi:plasmid stabilization system protein ParE